MATQTTNLHIPAFSLFAPVRAFFAAIGRGLVVAAENSSRMKRIEAFNAMTDEQLAERGLKRDEIVRHVFQDLMYV
ncbi:DUF1127 domain-containing protein [Aliiroseovarius marinus]|uniref:DUF1127 domain-containing protein n=1 Tax=Aliiroseovarius marinus TaxID=2500159 RepID=UPI0010612759|nr:DUF1127 domain-containing protein [Aliiroseovarius marinus]